MLNCLLNWCRYVRSLPTNQSFNLPPFNMQKIQLPFVQYDTCFPQLGQMPGTQASLGYRPAASSVMSPFCAMGSGQTSRDATYVQWPSAAMMYAHSYEQFRHAAFQVVYSLLFTFLFSASAQIKQVMLLVFLAGLACMCLQFLYTCLASNLLLLVYLQAPFCQQPLSFDYSQNH